MVTESPRKNYKIGRKLKKNKSRVSDLYFFLVFDQFYINSFSLGKIPKSASTSPNDPS